MFAQKIKKNQDIHQKILVCCFTVVPKNQTKNFSKIFLLFYKKVPISIFQGKILISHLLTHFFRVVGPETAN